MNPILPADSADWIERLQRDGYCIIPRAMPLSTIASLDRDLADSFAMTPFCQGSFYGETTKRFGRLLTRSSHAADLVLHATILAIVQEILGPHCDCIQLNVGQAVAVHPGAPAQAPHRDEDMWRVTGAETELLVNVIWPLTPFRAGNGATLVWPGSHSAAGRSGEADGLPLPAEMDPGSALMILGSTRHGAGANISPLPRRCLVIGYSLGWLKPYENLWLAYPPAVARSFRPELAALVGYRQHRPNLGNYEGQCPSILLTDPDHGPLAAIDALRPDQTAMVEAHRALQSVPG